MHQDAHDSLATYYSAADVFVLPSHYESLGFVVIEAMACGTPVVASRVGGIPSIVEHGSTGYLIPWRCPEAFATQIEVLLKNKDLHTFMSKKAIKKAYSLSWDSSSEKAANLYRYTGHMNLQIFLIPVSLVYFSKAYTVV